MSAEVDGVVVYVVNGKEQVRIKCVRCNRFIRFGEETVNEYASSMIAIEPSYEYIHRDSVKCAA